MVTSWCLHISTTNDWYYIQKCGEKPNMSCSTNETESIGSECQAGLKILTLNGVGLSWRL